MPSSAAGYATPIASSMVIAIATGSHRIDSVGATRVDRHHQGQQQQARPESDRLGQAPDRGSSVRLKPMFSRIERRAAKRSGR